MSDLHDRVKGRRHLTVLDLRERRDRNPAAIRDMLERPALGLSHLLKPPAEIETSREVACCRGDIVGGDLDVHGHSSLSAHAKRSLLDSSTFSHRRKNLTMRKFVATIAN